MPSAIAAVNWYLLLGNVSHVVTVPCGGVAQDPFLCQKMLLCMFIVDVSGE